VDKKLIESDIRMKKCLQQHELLTTSGLLDMEKTWPRCLWYSLYAIFSDVDSPECVVRSQFCSQPIDGTREHSHLLS
jgi:hypothetical protein